MFNKSEQTKIEIGFTEAAQDDDVTFFAALRAAIEAHLLVRDEQTQKLCDLESYVLFSY
jgi:hypothetical protein